MPSGSELLGVWTDLGSGENGTRGQMCHLGREMINILQGLNRTVLLENHAGQVRGSSGHVDAGEIVGGFTAEIRSGSSHVSLRGAHGPTASALARTANTESREPSGRRSEHCRSPASAQAIPGQARQETGQRVGVTGSISNTRLYSGTAR